MAKLWTGDEWRPLSENEALHRIDCGYIVLEDDDPRTFTNEPPAARLDAPVDLIDAAPLPPASGLDELSDEDLERLTAPEDEDK